MSADFGHQCFFFYIRKILWVGCRLCVKFKTVLPFLIHESCSKWCHWPVQRHTVFWCTLYKTPGVFWIISHVVTILASRTSSFYTRGLIKEILDETPKEKSSRARSGNGGRQAKPRQPIQRPRNAASRLLLTSNMKRVGAYRTGTRRADCLLSQHQYQRRFQYKNDVTCHTFRISNCLLLTPLQPLKFCKNYIITPCIYKFYVFIQQVHINARLQLTVTCLVIY